MKRKALQFLQFLQMNFLQELHPFKNIDYLTEISNSNQIDSHYFNILKNTYTKFKTNLKSNYGKFSSFTTRR